MHPVLAGSQLTLHEMKCHERDEKQTNIQAHASSLLPPIHQEASTVSCSEASQEQETRLHWVDALREPCVWPKCIIIYSPFQQNMEPQHKCSMVFLQDLSPYFCAGVD